MSDKFPHPCNRCGWCCIAKQCPASVEVFGQLPKGYVCPALSFDGDVSSCGLIAATKPEFRDEAVKALGIGEGCCVSARVIKDGVTYDFAAMPDEWKVRATRQVRSGLLPIYSGKTGERVA